MNKVLDRLSEIKGYEIFLCFLVSVISSFIGYINNGAIYAHVADYFGIAREINTLVLAVLFLGVAYIALRHPHFLAKKQMLLISLGSILTGLLVLSMALRSHDPVFSVIGLFFMSVGSCWALVNVALAIASLASLRAAILVVSGGYAVAEVMRSFIPVPVYSISIFIIAVSHILTITLVYKLTGPLLDKISQGTSASDMQMLNPRSFLTPSHGLFFCAFLFSFASGYALTINEVANAPIQTNLVDIALVFVAIWLIVSNADKKEDVLFTFSVLMVIAGFLMAPFTFLSDLASANSLIRIGIAGFDILIWLVIVAIGKRNLFALLPTFGIIRCMKSLGTNAGAITGHTSNDLVGLNVQMAELIAMIALFFFIAFLWIGFRHFSFSETIRGIMEPQELKPTQVEESNLIESRCNVIGEEKGLTAREREIFAMLARGRNSQYVMEHYVISRNTVKSHVKHIYQKLEVHSQQELIDLVEE